jgi:hypothetical protein
MGTVSLSADLSVVFAASTVGDAGWVVVAPRSTAAVVGEPWVVVVVGVVGVVEACG